MANLPFLYCKRAAADRAERLFVDGSPKTVTINYRERAWRCQGDVVETCTKLAVFREISLSYVGKVMKLHKRGFWYPKTCVYYEHRENTTAEKDGTKEENIEKRGIKLEILLYNSGRL